MRLPGAFLRHQERIDPPGRADQGHVRCDTFRNRFQESEISRAGQVPILGIPHHEIKNVLRCGQHDYSGVPRLGLNPHNLILGLDDPQHRPGVLSQQRHRQGQDRRRQKWNEFQHRITSVLISVRGPVPGRVLRRLRPVWPHPPAKRCKANSWPDRLQGVRSPPHRCASSKAPAWGSSLE